MYGKNVWLIADGFMSNTKTDKNVSHEAVCVLNLSGEKANVKITVYFEDEETPHRIFRRLRKQQNKPHKARQNSKRQGAENSERKTLRAFNRKRPPRCLSAYTPRRNRA